MSNNRIGIDNFPRTISSDNKISLDIRTLFRQPSGQEVLKYLRSITIEAVTGPAASDAELRHLEGQRYIVGLIERRIKHAEKVEKNGTNR